MKLLFFVNTLMLVVLFGCQAFEEKAAPQLAKAVDRYCENIPLPLRAQTRAAIQELVKPGTKIGAIVCPGDPVNQ